MASRLQEALDATLRTQLRAALTATGGDRDAAARFLGVSRRALYNYLDRCPEIREEFPASPGPPKKPRRTP